MSRLTLNTGHEIPLIGLGTYLINGTGKTKQVIDEALAAGYRLFDTAHMYDNEKYLGQAFKELLLKHKLTREDIFITTKFVPSTESNFENLVLQSLENLQTDYIDLFLIHWPGVYGLSNRSPDVIKYRHAAWNALTKLHRAGTIRSIGVSNFVIRHLEDLKRECEVIPALNQIEWHPKCHDVKLHQYCKENNIVLQAYSSLGTSSDTSLRKAPTIIELSKKLSCSPSQLLLRWATQRKVAIIPVPDVECT